MSGEYKWCNIWGVVRTNWIHRLPGVRQTWIIMRFKHTLYIFLWVIVQKCFLFMDELKNLPGSWFFSSSDKSNSTPSTYSSDIANNNASFTWMPSDSSKSIISGFSFMIAIDSPFLPRGSRQFMSKTLGLPLYILISLSTEAQSPLSTNKINRFSSGVKTYKVEHVVILLKNVLSSIQWHIKAGFLLLYGVNNRVLKGSVLNLWHCIILRVIENCEWSYVFICIYFKS